jgi:DNA-binding MurR/RpiR family transcriptional regulator
MKSIQAHRLVRFNPSDGKLRTRDVKQSLNDRVSERLLGGSRSLTPALRRVAEYIDANRHEAMSMSAIELGLAIGTSDATVVRAVQALGYAGLRELKEDLASVAVDRETPADNLNRTLPDIDDVDTAINHVLGAHREGVSRLASRSVRTQMVAAIEVLANAKRIAFFGIGPTTTLAEYACFSFSRNGRPGLLLGASGNTLADQLLHLETADALLMLAYGLTYPEAEATIAEARRCRVPIVLISDSLDERLARHAKVIVRAPRGRSDSIALHGTTLICIEAILLGVIARDRPLAVSALSKLNNLRQHVQGKRKNSL